MIKSLLFGLKSFIFTILFFLFVIGWFYFCFTVSNGSLFALPIAFAGFIAILATIIRYLDTRLHS
jgi:hypothetical protein